MEPSDITLSERTIHNPDEPRHFMRARPSPRRIVVRRKGEVIADTTNASRVMEVGKDVADPVLYIPRRDVLAALERVDGKTTHCPLKGDASYFQIDGSVAAWSYEQPFEFADVIRDRIAFYADGVSIEEIGNESD